MVKQLDPRMSSGRTGFVGPPLGPLPRAPVVRGAAVKLKELLVPVVASLDGSNTCKLTLEPEAEYQPAPAPV
jgi:hypothetical protein